MSRYESHITLLKPTSTEDAKLLFTIATDHNMKTSWITGDPVLGNGKWFYISGYSEDFNELLKKVKFLSEVLTNLGFEVIREKIEQIMYDTKTGHFECGVNCFACLTS